MSAQADARRANERRRVIQDAEAYVRARKALGETVSPHQVLHRVYLIGYERGYSKGRKDKQRARARAVSDVAGCDLASSRVVE